VRAPSRGSIACFFSVPDSPLLYPTCLRPRAMLFRASPPMISEDDSYELAQRRSRRRAKRRGPRKFRRYSPYSPNLTSARFLVVSALMCLLIYELFLLRASPASASKKSRLSAFSPPQTQQNYPPQQPVQVDTRSVLNARAKAVEEAAAARDKEALVRQNEAQAAAAAAAAVAAAAAAKKKKEMDDRRLPPPPPRDGENFWDWYQKSRRGGKIRCEEPNKRLCEMTYKMVHKYKVRTLYDLSCGRTASWMHIVLRKVSREIWGFRVWSFFVNVKRANVKYVLVDNYPGILKTPFIRCAQSPERFYLNLRKHPFRFPAAKEVVQNVTEPGETANRQLLFYDASTLPDNLG